MPATSAGILLYRRRGQDGTLEVLLVHPGGPLWARRDEGAWSIPKGETMTGEDPLTTARREFAEELGSPAPIDVAALQLGETRLKSGKRVLAWALEGDLDVATIISNTTWITWPPRSTRQIEVPEIDRAEWFDLDQARVRINAGQVALLDRLELMVYSRHQTVADQADQPSPQSKPRRRSD